MSFGEYGGRTNRLSVSAKDKARPVRVENAFPAVVSPEEFRHVARTTHAKATAGPPPARLQPLPLNELAKRTTCGKARSAHEAKSGQCTHYVCYSLLKKGKGTCKTRLPALRAVLVDEIRENILTESNIRDLVKLVDE